MNILGVIPARGGSQGIPRKNVHLLNGLPLIVYAIRAAQGSQHLSRFIVSTDNDEIADAARSAGADVPFMRPAALAQNTTPTAPVIQHAIMMLQPETFDVVVTIQATAPLRTAADIDAAIDLLAGDFDSVVSVAEVPHQFNPNWIHQIDDHELMPYIEGAPLKYTRRQDLPPVYYRNGAVYVTRCAALEAHNNLYGQRTAAYVMPPERSVNIDAPGDFVLAEYYLKAGRR
jgi:CMP-N,N'-diacetyllegionaminic acid synthase